jgi:hypothetical protein
MLNIKAKPLIEVTSVILAVILLFGSCREMRKMKLKEHDNQEAS